MGWKLKALAFVFALLALGAGALIIAIPLLAYVFLPWYLNRRKNRGTDGGRAGGGGLAWAKYLGFLLLALALIALASGGEFSVLLFGGVGAALVYLGSEHGRGSLLAPAAQKESILLRDRLLPFRWCSVAQVKSSAGDMAKVLVALNEKTVVRTEGKAAAFVTLQSSALTEAEAERKMVERLRELSRLLVGSGVYLLPLEAGPALSLIRLPCEAVKLDTGNLDHSLATQSYDYLTICPRGHQVVALGAYQKRENGPSRLTTDARQPLKKPVLVWEVAKSLEQRVKLPGPDDETVFMSSLAATRGADVGERVVHNGSGRGATLLVRSLRTPEIELSRAQLRALIRTYS